MSIFGFASVSSQQQPASQNIYAWRIQRFDCCAIDRMRPPHFLLYLLLSLCHILCYIFRMTFCMFKGGEEGGLGEESLNDLFDMKAVGRF